MRRTFRRTTSAGWAQWCVEKAQRTLQAKRSNSVAWSWSVIRGFKEIDWMSAFAGI